VTGRVGMDGRSAATEQEAHGAEHAHDVNRLPETVKDKDTLIEARGHCPK
jgi:hypothetical protein